MFKMQVTIYNPVFREPDENKIEVEDERGEKKKIAIIPCFRFIQID